MKLAVSWFCILHLAFVTLGLFTYNDVQASNLSSGMAKAPQSIVSSNQGRQRPLFARRGQFERQRIYVPKPKKVPVPSSNRPTPSRMPPKPTKPMCSQLTQSCLPLSGCCDPCATCHCRFFNAICFCRKTNSSHKNKT